MVDINRLALVRLKPTHTQSLAPSGTNIAPRIDPPRQSLKLDNQGDGREIKQPEYGENPPTPRSAGIERTGTPTDSTYIVKVINADTGEELEELTFDNKEQYDEWAASTNNLQIRILGSITRSEASPAPTFNTTEQRPYSGTRMPDRPTNANETQSFLEQLRGNNLFYGQGGLETYPAPEPTPLDLTQGSKESILSDRGKSLGLETENTSSPEGNIPSGASSTPDVGNVISDAGSILDAAKADLGLPDGLNPNNLGLGSVDFKSSDVGSPADKPGTAPVETTTTEKANIDRSGMLGGELDRAQLASNSGLLDRPCPEPVPEFKKISSDVVVSGKNNTWIVLGRDRPAGISTGYGPGLGHTQAGAIDIVVGRMSPFPQSHDREGNLVKASPIFGYALNGDGKQVCDAARIYISQKTDVDSNFSLADGVVGNMKARSAIAMKSDAIRIIARDSGIKLVTHHPQLPNSQGGTSSRNARGIDLIAGNDDSNLQPMILGNNLVEMLREMSDALDKTIGTLSSVIMNLAEVDMALATHFHPQSFPPGAPTMPSPTALPVCISSLTKLISLDAFSTFAEKWQLETISKTYLDAGGELSIRSSYNNLN